MDSSVLSLVGADAILLLHSLFVLFVVAGLALIVIGGLKRWPWVLNPWFRMAHGAAIGVVVLQSWCGAICPLTQWETALRSRAGEAEYSGSFIAHWLEELLYFHAPPWAFVICYTLFAAVVVFCWFWLRPRPFRKSSGR